MSRDLAKILFCLAVTTAAYPRVGHAAPSPPNVVIVDLAPRQLPAPHDKADLASELAEAIAGAGCQVARVCRSPDCRIAKPDEAGIRLLSFEGHYEASRFTCAVTLEVRRVAGGPIEYRGQASNPVCPVTQLIKDTREAGARACAELKSAELRAFGLQQAVAITGGNQYQQPPTTLTAEAAAPPAAWRAWVGPSLIAVGTGVAALGIYQATQHGDPTRCEITVREEKVCTHRKQRPLAVPLILLGVGTLGWGVWDTIAVQSDGADSATLVSVGGKF
jgi:hypothetical protein